MSLFSAELLHHIEKCGKKQSQVAVETGIIRQHLSEMKLGKRRCTAEYDVRLSRYFSESPGFWLALQSADLIADVRVKKGDQIEREVSPVS